MNNVTNSHKNQLETTIDFLKENALGNLLKKNISNPSPYSLPIEELAEEIYIELCDDILFGLILQIHRATKLGYLFYLQPDVSNDSKFQFFEPNDVIGVFSHLNADMNNPTNKSQAGRGGNSGSGSNNNNNYSSINKYECVCPSCDRNVAALRFAPHLEKCMGMGRNSSRIATRRIANYAGDDLDQLIESTGYIQNYSTNCASNKLHTNSNDTITNTLKSVAVTNISDAKLEYTQTSNMETNKSDDLVSIINSVATATTEINVSTWHKAPTAKKLKTKTSVQKIIPSGPSPTPSNNEDTTSQESELVKVSTAPGFSSTNSTVSISPSPNSLSSISSGSSSAISNNTMLTQCPAIFVDQKNEVLPSVSALIPNPPNFTNKITTDLN